MGKTTIRAGRQWAKRPNGSYLDRCAEDESLRRMTRELDKAIRTGASPERIACARKYVAWAEEAVAAWEAKYAKREAVA